MFVLGKLFQPSLMFVGSSKGLPCSGAPERCFTLVGPGLACKHWTRQERLAREKHSSLLQTSINYDSEKFYSTGPRCLCIKSFLAWWFMLWSDKLVCFCHCKPLPSLSNISKAKFPSVSTTASSSLVFVIKLFTKFSIKFECLSQAFPA